MADDPTRSNSILQLQRSEWDAERRYHDAIRQYDNEAAAQAAQDWKQAAAQLDEYLDLYVPGDLVPPPQSRPDASGTRA